ncbi:MAG: endonuclease/exonuclease/phosphatase family protein [bacterium]|nr:endonuclease/exonuclease/phosphatase family protein [bacterium]
MIKFLKKFIFSFNLVTIVLLLGAYASTIINPKDFWPIIFLGLAFPFLILINLFFVLFWGLQFNRRALYSAIALLIGYSHIQHTIQFNSDANTEDSDNKTLKIVSYNSALFGYYQSKWYVSETVEKINKIKPNIFCIQEFLNLGESGTTTLDSIKQACHFKYSYFENLNDGRKKGRYGIAIFSNYELKHKGIVKFKHTTGNMCIYADVAINNKIYRIYNVHLQSFRFKKKDFQFVEKLPNDNNEKLNQSKTIISRMKSAYTKRSEQVQDLKKQFDTLEIPYFVVGDFNDPPVSYAYQILSKNLKDAFVESGTGMGKTYVGAMPNFRIDYILYPPNFKGIFYKSHQLKSDHKLLETTIQY